MGQLRSCYPRAMDMDEGEWRAAMAMYYQQLSHYGADLLAQISGEIVRYHPDHFPTLGQVLTIASSASKRARSENRAAQLPAHEDPGPPERDAADDFELLAKGFIAQTSAMGLRGESDTPHRVGMERMRLVMELYDRHYGSAAPRPEYGARVKGATK